MSGSAGVAEEEEEIQLETGAERFGRPPASVHSRHRGSSVPATIKRLKQTTQEVAKKEAASVARVAATETARLILAEQKREREPDDLKWEGRIGRIESAVTTQIAEVRNEFKQEMDGWNSKFDALVSKVTSLAEGSCTSTDLGAVRGPRIWPAVVLVEPFRHRDWI